MAGDQDKDIQEGKFFAIISYVTFLCIVSLILKRDNKFVLYHAKQGLVIFVAEVVSFILSIIPVLGWLIKVFGFLVFTLVSVWGIIQAWEGNRNRFPLISHIADKIVI